MAKRVSIVSNDDPRFPMQAFFNAISDSSFVRTVADLLRGIGAGFDVACCEFPTDLDPGDEPFQGVRFSLYEDEFVADHETFRRFLLIACKAHLKEHPGDKAAIHLLLSGSKG